MNGVNHNERRQTQNETKPEVGKQQANKSKRMQGHGTKGGEEEFTRGVNRSEVNMMLQVFNKTAAWS